MTCAGLLPYFLPTANKISFLTKGSKKEEKEAEDVFVLGQ